MTNLQIQPARRICNTKVSTAIVMLLVAGALIWATLTVEENDQTGWTYFELGWPLTFMKRPQGIFLPEPKSLWPGGYYLAPAIAAPPTLRAFFLKPSATFYSFNPRAFIVNVHVAVAIIYLAAKGWEALSAPLQENRFRRRSPDRPLWQFHLSTAVVLALFAGVLLGINVMVARSGVTHDLLFPVGLSIVILFIVGIEVETAYRESRKP